MKSNVQFKLKDASIVLGVSPKDLQNLVQFDVLRPRRENRFFIFDSSALLQAKIAFYLKESLGTSVPLLARFTREIFKEMSMSKAKPGKARNISILSRPLSGKKPVRIEVPVQALAAELAAKLPATESPRKRASGAERNRWKEDITRTFAEAAEDIKGITNRIFSMRSSAFARNEGSRRRSP